MRGDSLRKEITDAFRNPTGKQREAYKRFAHTLAAASIIGAVTLLFSESVASPAWLGRIIGLALAGVIWLLCGAVLLKGE